MANGALSMLPQGALMQDQGIDPKTLALLQMGLAGMAASGPSRTPVGFGQILGQAGMQGLGAYQQALQGQQAAQMKAQQMAMQDQELQLRRADLERRQNQPISAGPGTQLFRPGETQPFYTVPFKTEPTPEAKPPMTRTVRMGDDTVTQEFVGGKWQEVGRGPAFAKSVVAPPGAEKPVAPPKPPKDFEWTDDTYTEVRPIKGGPKDTSKKDRARLDTAQSRANLVMGKVDEALGKVGFFSTGFIGSVLGNIAGTNAYDLRRTVDTIKANIGFNELQAMRESSPTGGALGAIAVQELNALQSVLASLDENQSDEQLITNLKQVKTHYENWKKAVSDAGEQAPQMGDTAPAAPTGDFPVPPPDAIRRLKMNPKERDQFDSIFGPGAAAKALGK